MIWTIVVNVIPVVLRSTNTQPIRDSYVDLGYLGNLHKYFYLLQMSECLEKVFANNRFLVGFYEKKEPYGLFWMVVHKSYHHITFLSRFFSFIDVYVVPLPLRVHIPLMLLARVQ